MPRLIQVCARKSAYRFLNVPAYKVSLRIMYRADAIQVSSGYTILCALHQTNHNSFFSRVIICRRE